MGLLGAKLEIRAQMLAVFSLTATDRRAAYREGSHPYESAKEFINRKEICASLLRKKAGLPDGARTWTRELF